MQVSGTDGSADRGDSPKEDNVETLAFAYPIQDHAALQRLQEHLRSDKAESLHNRHREDGIQEVKVFVQDKPSNMLIIVVEGNNLKQVSRDRHASAEVQQLNKLIEEATGHSPKIHAEQQPKLVHSWSA
jgi:hypothetical protein